MHEVLYRMGACDPAIEWATSYGYSYEDAWAECTRGDWMLWLAYKSGVPNHKLALAAERCVSGVYGDNIGWTDKIAMDRIRRWCDGVITHDTLMSTLSESNISKYLRMTEAARWAVYTVGSGQCAPHVVSILSHTADENNHKKILGICAAQVRNVIQLELLLGLMHRQPL